MQVYVVVSRYMFGVQDCAIYDNRKSALKHIEDNEIGGNPDVIKSEVFGDLEKDNHVFTASYYDPSHDVHILEGIYGNYEQAKSASGENGLVLDRDINS